MIKMKAPKVQTVEIRKSSADNKAELAQMHQSRPIKLGNAPVTCTSRRIEQSPDVQTPRGP